MQVCGVRRTGGRCEFELAIVGIAVIAILADIESATARPFRWCIAAAPMAERIVRATQFILEVPKFGAAAVASDACKGCMSALIT